MQRFLQHRLTINPRTFAFLILFCFTGISGFLLESYYFVCCLVRVHVTQLLSSAADFTVIVVPGGLVEGGIPHAPANNKKN